MKLAISVQAADADAPVDRRFGRARLFRIVDTGTGEQTVTDNADGINAAQGAGTQVAQMLARAGVGAVLTGHVGPKAWSALEAAGIAVYRIEDGTAGQAVEAYLSSKLPAMSPDQSGHHHSHQAAG